MRRALPIVAVAVLVLAVGTFVGRTGAASTTIATSCSPADQQYEGCGGGPNCTVTFERPIHDDIPADFDRYAPSWEGDSITIRLSGCPGTALSDARVTWFRDGEKAGTGLPYVVGAADVGHHLSARIEIDGNGTQIVDKQISHPVIYADPLQISPPTISGQENLHVGSTLTGSLGVWQLAGTDPGPLHYTYCWTNHFPAPWEEGTFTGHVVSEAFACNFPLGTSPTLTLTSAEVGHHIYLAVFAGGANVPAFVAHVADYAKTADVVAP